MKYVTIFLAILIASSSAFAQLINPGFEQWEGNDPVGWFTWNQFTNAVEPSGNAHSGQNSAHIMVDELYTGTWIEQTFEVADVDENVQLTVYFAQLTEGLELSLIILTDPIDGNVITVTESGGGWEPVTLEWEPMYEEYTSLTVWIQLGPVEDAVVGSVLIDDVTLTGVTGLGVNSNLEPVLNGWELSGVYPNPFNSTTTISFNLPSVTGVDLTVYDLSGRRVATLAGGFMEAGNHRLTWMPEAISGGVYIVRLAAGGQVFNTRAIYLK